ncbi:PAS domain S-box protein [Marinoscillum sp.]|uniref:PAS domain S-box protein n=1 Tax=Marinoscillum sp. TaxID=2024838 RepID=UPI003BABE60F
MNTTLVDGSDWSEDTLDLDFNPGTESSLIVYGLSDEVLSKIVHSNDQPEIQIRRTSGEILPNSITLIHQNETFTYDGRSIVIASGKSSDELADIILRNYPQGSITLLAEDYTILYTSGTGYSEYDMDPKTMSGINIREILLEDIYVKFLDAAEKARKGGIIEYESEFSDRYYLTSICMLVDSETRYFLLRSQDVTDKHEVETALMESEERNRYFLNNSQEVVCTHDMRGNYKMVSPSVTRILGYDPQEMIGKHPYDFTHPKDKDILREGAWVRLMRGEHPENIQYRARKKDGKYIWMDSYTDIVRDQQGHIVSLTTASREITAIKKIEIELRKSEERFRGIADNLPGVIYLCHNDANYSMIYLNDAVEELTGYPKEAFLNGDVSFVDLYHPDDKERIFKRVDQALEGRKHFRITYRLKNIQKEGYVWVEEYGHGIFEEDQLVTIEGVLLNITQKIEDQKRLEQSEANLKSIFESTTSIIALFDEVKNLVEFNSSFREYVSAGENFELLPGPSFWDNIDQEKAKEFKAYQDRALKGEKFSVTTNYITPYAELFFLVNYNPIYTNKRITGVSVFIQDITELTESQKQLESYAEKLELLVKERTVELETKNEELIKGNEQLEAALNELQSAQNQLIHAEKMASLGVLSSGIAHEINNPLNFVKNGSVALFDHIRSMQGYNKELFEPYFELISEGVERVANIIRSLSHFSRQVKSMEENCNLSEIIENCLVILQNKLKDRIHVDKNLNEDLIVIGNEGKLHQAILNILSNAEQAIDQEGTISIHLFKSGTLAVVEIEDDGAGIPPEHLSKISDPFFTTKPPGVGTGLGLFITYSIIDEHEGKVQVFSELKKGTKIRIELPNS